MFLTRYDHVGNVIQSLVDHVAIEEHGRRLKVVAEGDLSSSTVDADVCVTKSSRQRRHVRHFFFCRQHLAPWLWRWAASTHTLSTRPCERGGVHVASENDLSLTPQLTISTSSYREFAEVFEYVVLSRWVSLASPPAGPCWDLCFFPRRESLANGPWRGR